MAKGRLCTVAAYAFSAAAFAATIACARGADALSSGTYAEISPETKQVLAVGNEVVLARGARGKLLFSVNAIRRSDDNLGYIGGMLPRTASKIVWTSEKEFARCRLTFVALAPAMLQVTQDVRFGDCGFGYGVSADGVYKRTRATGKLGPWNGP